MYVYVLMPVQTYIHIYIHRYIDTYICTCVIPERFEAESFPLKYNTTTSECKIDSVEVDLHYFK